MSKQIYDIIKEAMERDNKSGIMAGFMMNGHFSHMRNAMECYAMTIAIETVAKYNDIPAETLWNDYRRGQVEDWHKQ
jgi:hypothetical protein